MIDNDPTSVTFYTRNKVTWEGTGRIAPAGSRTFGRVGQSKQLTGTELVGRQLHVLELPHDTAPPNVNDEVRTSRQGVEQRFTVVTVLPSPWKLEVVLDESG
jgi:hypothetical protein